MAAVLERDGRFLMVEERVAGKLVYNQPAGHLEDDEGLIAAVVRETLEETAWHFQPQALCGIYRWRHPLKQETWLRVAIAGEGRYHEPDRELDADIERMRRINHTISETRDKQVEYKDTSLRQIDYLVITPSRDVREIVARYVGNFPLSVRILLKGIGALAREGRPLMSYLMFDAPYCKELMELGYEDAIASRDQILHLLGYDELIEETA